MPLSRSPRIFASEGRARDTARGDRNSHCVARHWGILGGDEGNEEPRSTSEKFKFYRIHRSLSDAAAIIVSIDYEKNLLKRALLEAFW